ncbi:MAG: DUF1080 domain-containing protein [Armatimonadota bacterium]|jgi:hypothetical protein
MRSTKLSTTVRTALTVLAILASAALVLFLLSTMGGAGMSADEPEGEWTELFNGKDFTGWRALSRDGKHAWRVAKAVAPKPEDEKKFAIEPGEGIFVNGDTGRTANFATEMKHSDCELHIEFVVPKGSNSGVYLMGHYEIQVLDSSGKDEVKYSDCGGIYCQWIDGKAVGGTPPRVNASKAPGEWQTFDAIFRGPRFDKDGNKIENAVFVKVVHNGVVVHENVEVGGPTRASMPGPERAEGPLMLQGDHGPVAYRNVRMRPLKP